jgi:hypothetical protein
MLAVYPKRQKLYPARCFQNAEQGFFREGAEPF